MAVYHWFLPTTGDGDQVGSATVTAGAAAHARTPTVAYQAVGVDEFILSGWPHLEEAARVGQVVTASPAPVPA